MPIQKRKSIKKPVAKKSKKIRTKKRSKRVYRKNPESMATVKVGDIIYYKDKPYKIKRMALNGVVIEISGVDRIVSYADISKQSLRERVAAHREPMNKPKYVKYYVYKIDVDNHSHVGYITITGLFDAYKTDLEKYTFAIDLLNKKTHRDDVKKQFKIEYKTESEAFRAAKAMLQTMYKMIASSNSVKLINHGMDSIE